MTAGETAPRMTGARWWFVTRKYPPAIGGMERLSYELTTRMAQRRPITVIAMRRRAWALPMFITAAAWRLLLASARGEVDVVHLSDGVLAPLALIPRAFRIPVAVTLHGLDVVCAGIAYRVWRTTFLRRFDAYVCNSPATREAAAAAGLSRPDLHVIGIGVDVPADVPPSRREPECLLFVGRLVRRKGLAWFVREVLPALAAEKPGLRLVILGDGPEREAVIAGAREAGVAERLSWPALRDDTQKAAWFARATLCIMPNIAVPGDMEGFGMVALEAAAAGCLVVGADIEGVRHALAHGRAGVLLPSQDAAAWARAIRDWLDDPVQRERAADDARRYVAQCCRWDDVVDAYERLFAAAIVKREAPVPG